MALNRDLKGTSVLAASAALFSALALLRSSPVVAGQAFTLDQATKDLLAAMGLSVQATAEELDDLIAALPGMLQRGGGTPPNSDNIANSVVLCPIAGRPYRLPDMVIPDTMSVVIKALPTNAIGSFIYVGSSQAAAIDPNQTYWLVFNEPVSYKIKNASVLYISTNVAGSGAIVSAEIG